MASFFSGKDLDDKAKSLVGMSMLGTGMVFGFLSGVGLLVSNSRMIVVSLIFLLSIFLCYSGWDLFIGKSKGSKGSKGSERSKDFGLSKPKPMPVSKFGTEQSNGSDGLVVDWEKAGKLV